MTNSSHPPTLHDALKAMTKAELIARIEALPCAPTFETLSCPVERLRLELGTHQVELEAQNQALRESRLQIEEMLARYSDLYDFAPVGYLTLDKGGYVLEINLTGADMLGSGRQEILSKPLGNWLAPESHRVLRQHLANVFLSTQQLVDEVLLHPEGGQQRHISIVSVAISHNKHMPQACRSVIVDITKLKQKEAELTLSHQQMRNLSAHLDQVREDERKRMAREIHDELGQKLATLRFDVSMLSKRAALSSAQDFLLPSQLLKEIDEIINSMRAIAADLRPAVLDLGLVAAIEWQMQEFHRRTGIPYQLINDEVEIPLDNERATAVFRILQESLTNIIRHAQASRVEVRVSRLADILSLQIYDNGIGIAENALKKSRSFGIAGMRERVRLLDGSMKLSSRAGHGTNIKISIPLREQRDQVQIWHPGEE